METLYGLVPLRSGSKSIPDKNVKMLHGKPLFAWPIDEMLKSGIFTKITVSTESDRYMDLIRDYYEDKVFILNRPDKLATDTASLESVMKHYISHDRLLLKDDLLTVQVTSPLVKASDYKQAFKKYLSVPYNSLLTGVRSHRFFWDHNGHALNYNYLERPRRQEWDGCIIENGAFYISSVRCFFISNNRLGGNIGIHEMHPDTLTELDEPADWEYMEYFLRGKDDESTQLRE